METLNTRAFRYSSKIFIQIFSCIDLLLDNVVTVVDQRVSHHKTVQPTQSVCPMGNPVSLQNKTRDSKRQSGLIELN